MPNISFELTAEDLADVKVLDHIKNLTDYLNSRKNVIPSSPSTVPIPNPSSEKTSAELDAEDNQFFETNRGIFMSISLGASMFFKHYCRVNFEISSKFIFQIYKFMKGHLEIKDLMIEIANVLRTMSFPGIIIKSFRSEEIEKTSSYRRERQGPSKRSSELYTSRCELGCCDSETEPGAWVDGSMPNSSQASNSRIEENLPDFNQVLGPLLGILGPFINNIPSETRSLNDMNEFMKNISSNFR